MVTCLVVSAMCIVHLLLWANGQIRSRPQGVTRQRCGLLPNYFGLLFIWLFYFNNFISFYWQESMVQWLTDGLPTGFTSVVTACIWRKHGTYVWHWVAFILLMQGQIDLRPGIYGNNWSGCKWRRTSLLLSHRKPCKALWLLCMSVCSSASKTMSKVLNFIRSFVYVNCGLESNQRHFDHT